jgi:sigma-B regulation protein RsbU (phosphoserine phosphatase)
LEDNLYRPLISIRDDSLVYVPKEDKLPILFYFLLSQAKRLVEAKNGSFFYYDEHFELVSFGSVDNQELATRLALESFQEKRNNIIRKSKEIQDSYLVCFVGDDLGEQILGVIVLESIEHFDNFSNDDLELLEYFSRRLGALFYDSITSQHFEKIYTSVNSSMMTLLDNATFHQKNNRLEYLLKEVMRVSQWINSTSDLSKCLELVMESAKSVFRTEACSLLMLDDKKEYLYFHTILGEKKDELSKIKVPMGVGVAGMVAKTKEPMIINDAPNDPRVYKDADKKSKFQTRNILAAPLMAGDEVIGVIEAINTIDRNNFHPSDINLFLNFSDACALSIQKSKLLSDLEEKVTTLGSLFKLGQSLLESKDINYLLRSSIQIIYKEFNAIAVGVYLISEKDKKWDSIAYYQNSYWENKFSTKQNNKGTEIFPFTELKIVKEFSFLTSDSEKEILIPGITYLIPFLEAGIRPIGFIAISGMGNVEELEQSKIQLLSTISTQLTKSIENLKLSEQMIEKKSMQKEIEITREIQKNILPSSIISNTNFEIGIKSFAARDVSGDFFDYHQYPDGQYSFLIADVSGKSLPAAIFMAMSSSIIRTLARPNNLTPAQILEQSNELIYEDSQSGMFVTLFYIHYNPSRMTLDFASAGHNDQLLIRNDNSYELIKGKGPPLGVAPVARYQGGTMKINPGDMIVLYTDGVTEQPNPRLDEFGLERLIQEIIERKHLHPIQITEEINRLVSEFAEGVPPFDDFTLFILKFNEDFQFYKKFKATNSSIPAMRNYISKILSAVPVDEMIIDDILLCCDEAGTNVVMHAYKDTLHPDPQFELKVKIDEEKITLEFRDHGMPFRRDKVASPSLEANLRGERKGGFGVFLMEKLMDKVSYYYENGENRTLLEKRYK